MKRKLFQNKLVVKKSPTHGYGVFALKPIKKGELIEECYILVSKNDDKGLEDFYFEVTRNKNAIFTGFGSIYNHNDEPNADYTINLKKRLATIKADTNIAKGEEIFVSYGQEWFDTRDMKPKNLAKKSKKRKRRRKKG